MKAGRACRGPTRRWRQIERGAREGYLAPVKAAALKAAAVRKVFVVGAIYDASRDGSLNDALCGEVLQWYYSRGV